MRVGTKPEARRTVRRNVDFDCGLLTDLWDEPVPHRVTDLSETGIWISPSRSGPRSRSSSRHPTGTRRSTSRARSAGSISAGGWVTHALRAWALPFKRSVRTIADGSPGACVGSDPSMRSLQRALWRACPWARSKASSADRPKTARSAATRREAIPTNSNDDGCPSARASTNRTRNGALVVDLLSRRGCSTPGTEKRSAASGACPPRPRRAEVGYIGSPWK